MTITLQAVNELIASLESAGELSIKETKVMALAKAFKQLAAENAHLENRKQQLIEIIRNADNDYCMCGDLMKSHLIGGCGHPIGMFDYHYNKWLEEDGATPATDHIVAGIKADGVEEFAAYQRSLSSGWASDKGPFSCLKIAEDAEGFAQKLREGADK